MRVLVTGSAGFIGSALSHRLLARGDQVIGLDNVNDYYEVSLKEARLAPLKANPAFTEARMGLEQRDELNRLFEQHKPERVVNLAAQAGVRYSLKNPHATWIPTSSASATFWRPAATTGGAFGLRLQQFGVRGQHHHAVLGAPQRGPSLEPVRRQQESQRADGPYL